MVQKVLLVLCFLASAGISYSQPANLASKRIRFEQFPDDPNLSENSINCVLQDYHGFLWIGTWSGLIRYDGYSTTTFHASGEPGKLKSNQISTLYEDSDHHLWVGTIKGGLYQYQEDRDSFIEFSSTNQPVSLVNNNVRSIQEDKFGNLWIGTEGGLSVLPKGDTAFHSFTAVSKSADGLPDNAITDLLLSSSGILWLATGKGLCELVPGATINQSKFRTYIYEGEKDDHDAHNWVISVCEFQYKGTSTIWFTTSKGLKRLHNGNVENFLPDGTNPTKSLIMNVLCGEYDEPYLLLGTDNGLAFFNPINLTFNRFLNIEDADVNLSNNSITALYLDRGGVLWVGTKKGLDKYNTYLNDFNGIPTNQFDHTGSIITGIQQSTSGGYWISTLGGGLFRYQGRHFEHFTFPKTARDEFAPSIQAMFRDRRGYIWVGTAGSGVFCFKDNAPQGGVIHDFMHFDDQTSERISSNFVMSFTEDNIGNVWIGTWSSGLGRISSDFKAQIIDVDLRDKPIVVMLVDHLGVLWIGTRGNGLFSLNPDHSAKNSLKHFQAETQQRSLTDHFITSLYEDDKGKLWIGTENGLKVFDRQSATFSHIPIAGIDNDVVVSFLQDAQGRLWIANWDGLHVVDLQSPNDVKHYDRHDEVKGGFFYNNVCLKDLSGNLLFGGSEGFNLINPANLIPSSVVPDVYIEKFSIAHQEIEPGRQYHNQIILTQSVNEVRKIALKYFQNSISFNFAALDFSAPDKTRYAYMLAGFEKEWNYTTSGNRIANYTNLNPGGYTFLVKASTIDGRWSDKVRSVTIEIANPWWKTIWANIIYVVLVFVVLYLFRNYVLVRARVLHDFKIERIHRENIEKLNQAKLQFFTNISHEFRTPLTLIIGPMQTMLAEIPASSRMHNLVRVANENAQRLLRLINQLLDFRKVETEHMKLSLAEGNIVQLVQEVVHAFASMAETHNISLSIEGPHAVSMWFDWDKCEKIFLNLISNAFKHTPDGGKILISIVESDQDVSISVCDSGDGIDEGHLEDIFQPFYSLDENKTHSSTGIGLALVKGLVELHHGTIRVDSKKQEFSRFLVVLRKSTEHIPAEERVDVLNSIMPRISRPVEEYRNGDLTASGGKIDEDGQPRQMKLLIIDDNDEMRDYICSVFNSSYQVIEAADGIEGFETAAEFIPDVVIADVMMPNLNGIDMCKKLKHDEKTCHIPVILLTARDSVDYKLEGLEGGADEYVTKPFNPTLLQLMVRNLINRRDTLHAYFNNQMRFAIEPRHITLSRDEQFIKNALELVEMNIGNASYTVEDMSKDVGMSHAQLYRKIKALTGNTINEFIRAIRIKRAAQLLEQRQLSVSEITYQVGFTDLQHFRECFKKVYGITPSQYAQKSLETSNQLNGVS